MSCCLTLYNVLPSVILQNANLVIVILMNVTQSNGIWSVTKEQKTPMTLHRADCLSCVIILSVTLHILLFWVMFCRMPLEWLALWWTSLVRICDNRTVNNNDTSLYWLSMLSHISNYIYSSAQWLHAECYSDDCHCNECLLAE